MSSNIVNRQPYIRTSRDFTQVGQALSVELNKSYIDVANAVNLRIIGLFPSTRPAITGEQWYINTNQMQQTFRQAFLFTTTSSIDHGINTANIFGFSSCYGQFTDGTNFYGLISGSNVAIAGQISFYVTPTQIVFLTGAGAPALTRGTIVLQWLSQV